VRDHKGRIGKGNSEDQSRLGHALSLRHFLVHALEASRNSFVLLIVLSVGVAPVLAQTKPSATTKTKPETPASRPQRASAEEESRLKQYLDKTGGYKDKLGGYYNPVAGTYTDKDGGIVDNWGGYIYIPCSR
jgi:hypothetical protein